MCLSFLCSRLIPLSGRLFQSGGSKPTTVRAMVAEQELGCPAIIVNPQPDGNISSKLMKLRQEDGEFEAMPGSISRPPSQIKIKQTKEQLQVPRAR